MKKINFSIIINLLLISFLIASFYGEYETELFITRITLIIFALFYLLFEIKKEYISKNRTIFIIFSLVSIVSVIISIIVDNSSLNDVMNKQSFFVVFYTYILISIMYKEVYPKNKQ